MTVLILVDGLPASGKTTLADALRARGWYAWDSALAQRWVKYQRLPPEQDDALDVLASLTGQGLDPLDWGGQVPPPPFSRVLQILCVVSPDQSMHRLGHRHGLSEWSIADLQDQVRLYHRWRDAAFGRGIPVLELATSDAVGARVAVAQAVAWIQTKLAG